MNNTIYVDAKMTDDQRRTHLYDGQLFVFSPREASLAFTEFARGMICEGFHCSDPTLAQEQLRRHNWTVRYFEKPAAL